MDGCSGYAAFVGWFMIAVILVSTTLMQASRNASDLWLAYWVDSLRSGVAKDTSSYLVWTQK